MWISLDNKKMRKITGWQAEIRAFAGHVGKSSEMRFFAYGRQDFTELAEEIR